MIALTRGLEAVAAGDPADAQRHAKAAQRQLEEPNLTRLLTAQAAHLAGDKDTAEESYSAMLESPETEFLGLRGLYLQALSRRDQQAAREYADRAFKLRPNAQWAFESSYRLSVERGAWGEAHQALRLAQKSGMAKLENVERKKAALLTAKAYAAFNVADKNTAGKELKAALKHAPSFAPAATLAARIEASKNQVGKAAKIIETAWELAPHPALVAVYESLYEDDNATIRAERLEKLALKAPDRAESKLLLAQRRILLKEWEAAQKALEPLLMDKPNARTYTAMAEVMRGLYGEEQALPWLDKAAVAPLEPLPGVEGDFHFTTDGWRRLIREYGDHNRLAPPPLEDLSDGVTSEELALLTAPPPEPEPEPEPITFKPSTVETIEPMEPPKLPPDAVVTGLPEQANEG